MADFEALPVGIRIGPITSTSSATQMLQSTKQTLVTYRLAPK